MTMPDLTANSRLNTQEWDKGVSKMLKDLAQLQKQSATIKISAQLAGKADSVKAVTALTDAVKETSAPVTAMQQRIRALFQEYETGSKSAAASAEIFKAQQDAVRAKIQELDRAVKITRAQFQQGLGDATPEEVARLTAEMNRLQAELNAVGDTAKREFGEYSREMQQVANANRLASVTAQAAAGQITRLGLASQVKLGVGAALQGYSGQAQMAGANLLQFAQMADKARISAGLFDKTVQKMGGGSTQAAESVAVLTDKLGVSEDAARESIRGLLRQGYTLEQSVTALTGAGASALAAGKDAQYGMQAYVEASTSMSSAMLNEIGISENLSTFYQRYAKSLGKTVDELTKQEKAQAEINLIMAATGDEVGDLESVLSGLGGGMNSVNREFMDAAKGLGGTFIPFATKAMNVASELLKTFNGWDEGTQTVAAGAAALGVGTLAAAGPISSLVEIVKNLIDGYKNLKGSAPVEALEETADAAGGVQGALDEAANTIDDAQGKWETFTGAFDSAKGQITGLNGKWADYRTSVLAATGANNLWSVSAWKMIGTNLLTWIKTTTTAWKAQLLAMAPNIAMLGAAAAAVTGLTAAVVSYNTAVNNIADNEEWAANSQARTDAVLKAVQELNKENTEYSRSQAKLLLLEDQLATAKEGEIVSIDYWGKITREVNEEQVTAIEEQIALQKEKNAQLYEEERKRRVLAGLTVELTDEERAARAQAAKDLDATLKDRKFTLGLEGKTELQAELAQLGQDFDKLREQAKAPFYIQGALHLTPELKSMLDQLDAQKAAEETALRARAKSEAADSAAEIAQATQRAEIEAMQEGAAKKRALRELEIQELEASLAEQAEALTDFPELQAQAVADGQRQVAALRRQQANEDAQEAREEAEQRAEEAQRVEKLVLDARKAARDAEIAAIRDEGQRTFAERQAQLDDERQATAERLAEVERGSAAYYAVLEAGNRKASAMQQRWIQEDEEQAREAARRIARAWADAAAAQGEAKLAALEAQQARFELNLARQVARAGEGSEEAAQLEAQAINRRFELQAQAASEALAQQRRNLELSYREAVSAEDLTAQERTAIYQRFTAEREQLDQEYLAGAYDRLAQQEEAERAAAEAILEARKKAAQEPVQAAERDAGRLSSMLGLVRTDQAYERLQGMIAANLDKQLNAQRTLLSQADDLQLTAEERQEIEDAIFDLQVQQVQAQQEQQERAKRLVELAQQRRDAELAYAVAVARTDAEQVAALQAQLAEARARRDTAAGQAANAGTQEARNEAAQEYYGLQQDILGLEQQIASVPLGTLERRISLRESERDLLLETLGLQDDPEARAEVDLASAQERVGLAREALALATTQAEQEAAQLTLNQALTTEKQAQRALSEVQAGDPVADLERRVALSQALTAEALERIGLGDNETAQAQAQLLMAQQQLELAQARANAARTPEQQEEALTELSTARLGVLQAERGVRDALAAGQKKAAEAEIASAEKLLRLRREEIEGREQAADLAAARARVEAQVRGLGDDAVYQADLDLEINRQHLKAVTERLELAEALKLTLVEQAQLTEEQLTLTREAEELEQRRTLALFDRYQAERGLMDARRQLDAAQRGQGDQAMISATQALAAARRDLFAAEQDYARVLDNRNRTPEQELAATNKLTNALLKQQDAVRAIGDAYGQAIGRIDGIQSAADRLNKVVNGDRFDAQREMDRLRAIEQRRTAAGRRLQEALNSGNRELIQQAADAYADQAERYQQQVEKIEEQTGRKVITSGELQTERLADQLDRLGIEGDREAARLIQRQQAVDQEAAALNAFGVSVDELGAHIQRFGSAAASLGQIQAGITPPTPKAEATTPASGGADRVLTPGDLGALSTQLAQVSPKALEGLLSQSSPLVSSLDALRAGLNSLAPLTQLTVPATQPAPSMTYTDNTQLSVTVNGGNPQEVRAVLEGWWQGKVSEHNRGRAFNGPCGGK